MKFGFLAVLAGAVLGAAPAPAPSRTFSGVVSDSMCGNAGHAAMRMGPTDADCTLACIQAHGDDLRAEGFDTTALLDGLVDTPTPQTLLQRFVQGHGMAASDQD